MIHSFLLFSKTLIVFNEERKHMSRRRQTGNRRKTKWKIDKVGDDTVHLSLFYLFVFQIVFQGPPIKLLRIGSDSIMPGRLTR